MPVEFFFIILKLNFLNDDISNIENIYYNKFEIDNRILILQNSFYDGLVSIKTRFNKYDISPEPTFSNLSNAVDELADKQFQLGQQQLEYINFTVYGQATEYPNYWWAGCTISCKEFNICKLGTMSGKDAHNASGVINLTGYMENGATNQILRESTNDNSSYSIKDYVSIQVHLQARYSKMVNLPVTLSK